MEYHKKFYDLINDDLIKIKNPNILEFGVKDGISTSIFLKACEKSNGKLISIDVENYSHLFKSKCWKFIQSRDDDYTELEKYFNSGFDIICLDTIHKKKHVEKMINYYYEKLNVNGFFLIDGISDLPYLKNSYRNNFFSEINNSETSDYLKNLYFNNSDKFDLYFSYIGSGLAKIKKFRAGRLEYNKNIKSRKNSLKNFIRIFLKK